MHNNYKHIHQAAQCSVLVHGCPAGYTVSIGDTFDSCIPRKDKNSCNMNNYRRMFDEEFIISSIFIEAFLAEFFLFIPEMSLECGSNCKWIIAISIILFFFFLVVVICAGYLSYRRYVRYLRFKRSLPADFKVVHDAYRRFAFLVI